MQYHINPKTGRPNICRAHVRACPIAGPNAHFSTKDQAVKSYEKSMQKDLLSTVSKSSKQPPPPLKSGSAEEVEARETLHETWKRAGSIYSTQDAPAVDISTLRAEQGRWFDTLNEDELDAVSVYSRPTHHRRINAGLRHDSLTGVDQNTVQALDSALSKHESTSGERTVYRGLSDTEGFVASLKKGKKITLKGFTSTSLSMKSAAMFTHDRNDPAVLMEIVTSKGAPVDLGEKELLLPRDQGFHVMDIKPGCTLDGRAATVVQMVHLPD